MKMTSLYKPRIVLRMSQMFYGVSIISEDRPFNDITIFFEDKVFALMVDFKKPIYTRQQYFAFEGFCKEYGLRLTEYVNEKEVQQ